MDVVLKVRDDRDDGHEDGGLARGKVFGKSNVSLSYQTVILGGVWILMVKRLRKGGPCSAEGLRLLLEHSG